MNASAGSHERDPALAWVSAAVLAEERDPVLRSWMSERGLLTRRMRAQCGERFRMQVLGEWRDAQQLVREVALCDRDRPWIFARTRVPLVTLARHEWLQTLGASALGESIEQRGDGRRSEFQYARLAPADSLISRALERSGLPPQPLWVRRYRFSLGSDSLSVQEVFLPSIGVLD